MAGVLSAVAAALLALVLLVFLVVAVGYAVRHRLRNWARQVLVDTAGPAVVRSLPPRDVLDAVLGPLYGTRYDDVVVGVLGGPGREPGGRDTAISRSASAHFRLESIADGICRAEATWTYEFSGKRDNHTLVIFGTHEPDMAAIVTQRRVYPIYEMWLLNNEDELEDFVDDLRAAVEIGVTYRDGEGVLHTVPPRPQHGEEVAWGDYQKFLRLPDDANRADLRMVSFDLHDLADPDHYVRSVERLTLRASNNGANLGYFNWSAPYPCYVDDIEFQVDDLPWEGEEFSYTVVASTATWYRQRVQPTSMPIDGKLRLSLNSWVMAGHGVTLLWRPADRTEPRYGLEGR